MGPRVWIPLYLTNESLFGEEGPKELRTIEGQILYSLRCSAKMLGTGKISNGSELGSNRMIADSALALS